MTGTRHSVLTIYRTILRTAQKWEAASGKIQDTREEREFIQQETRTLFKKNMQLSDPSEIKICLKEAESRLELALHYKSPYPRAVNIPPMGLPPTKSRGKKAQDRLRKQAKPIYLHSQDDT